MISIVVATRNRPQLLRGLLQSIQVQDLMPKEVIIVDASDEYPDFDHQEYSFELKHVRSMDASISRQRNLALSLVSKDSLYFAVLDDDTYPEPDYLKKIVSFLQSTDNAVGASGVTADNFPVIRTRSWTTYLKHLFFLESSQSGKITKGAINIGLRTKRKFPIESDWLIGCSVYKIKQLGNLVYESCLDGYSLGEDVIFSYKASAHGKLYILPDVRLPHLQYSVVTHYKNQYWFKWSSYRRTLVTIMPGKFLKWMFYWWANFGQMLVVLSARKDSTIRNRLSSVLSLIRGSLNG
jgi:glycosyltransferase involved in cell wall biosynthesis